MKAIHEPSLDLTRLEKVRRYGTKITARCPACAATGSDRKGDHLAILPNGKFACAALPGDSEHRREIFALVGVKTDRQRDPELDRQWRARQAEVRKREYDRRKLTEAATGKRRAIVDRYAWTLADVWHDSPWRLDEENQHNPRFFVGELFHPDAVVWTGEVFHSGSNHAQHWRSVSDWIGSTGPIGPMISPATWPAGCVSRNAESVLTAPYVILDFDELDGRKPTTAAEIDRHVADSLAIVRWLREGLHWELAAIVWTGGKSIHGWFHNPGAAALQSLSDAAGPLGIDAGLIGRPEHPARLPGQRHSKTGQLSKTLWLQS